MSDDSAGNDRIQGSILQFECPTNRVGSIDKSKELYYLKLQQLSSGKDDSSDRNDIVQNNPAPRKQSVPQTIPSSSSENERMRRPSFVKRSSTKVIHFPEVVGSYQFYGGFEETGLEETFIPPHLARHDSVGECYSFS